MSNWTETIVIVGSLLVYGVTLVLYLRWRFKRLLRRLDERDPHAR